MDLETLDKANWLKCRIKETRKCFEFAKRGCHGYIVMKESYNRSCDALIPEWLSDAIFGMLAAYFEARINELETELSNL